MKCITILLLLVGFSLALPLPRKQLEDDAFQLAAQVLAECLDRPNNFAQCIQNSQIPNLQNRLVDLVDILMPELGQVIRPCKDYSEYFAQCVMDNLNLSPLNDILGALFVDHTQSKARSQIAADKARTNSFSNLLQQLSNVFFTQEKNTLRTAIAQAFVAPKIATDLCILLGCGFK